MFILAHLSDPHLAPLPFPHIFELGSKRLLGYLNWQGQRIAIHRADVLDTIIADLKAQAPNHIAVTGDLVNVGLPVEFTNARKWLESLGTPADVTLVPGNHDAYVRSVSQLPTLRWGDYMRGDDVNVTPTQDSITFPFLRRRGPVALIGVTTAVATPPLMATGEVGTTQLGDLSELLEQLGRESLFRILLIHHPPAGHRAGHKRLTDTEALGRVLRDRGVELVLHGHDHLASLNWLPGPRGPIAVIGVPSASARASGNNTPAAYNLYRIEESSGGWRCEVVSRGYHRNGSAVLELGRKVLTPGQQS
jgi:3',5'-cyclic AMP phosphodiesterase CpdA